MVTDLFIYLFLCLLMKSNSTQLSLCISKYDLVFLCLSISIDDNFAYLVSTTLIPNRFFSIIQCFIDMFLVEILLQVYIDLIVISYDFWKNTKKIQNVDISNAGKIFNLHPISDPLYVLHFVIFIILNIYYLKIRFKEKHITEKIRVIASYELCSRI